MSGAFSDLVNCRIKVVQLYVRHITKVLHIIILHSDDVYNYIILPILLQTRHNQKRVGFNYLLIYQIELLFM